ncbi:MAG TPA: LLM class flavin-dependent oxidoreductase [Methylomirabilota bacterium]|jgi:alkanesulfonate monooxygenase SsuD/methylene tetrahydromethanopterin reductase-like flavin-dependent oxidoreductase (luciferase family)|nr:LLM class flavin-dependent oxidoreductase [Methylomirabilota bacterium]
MKVELGVFTMPFHHPARDYGTILEEDQEAIVLADQLGFTEVYVGEHFSSWSERITSPLIFLATVINRTRQIKLGTGVINLPQIHPATVAAYAAMFDHLAGGRFIFGIGPGGLVSDFELFDVGQAEQRPHMMVESIETILALWAQDPPYRIDGKFWKINVDKAIWPEFKVGWVPRPLQQPHPPIALSILTPNSNSARVAGERGWIPVSGNFFHRRYLRGHWERYAEGCEAVGRRPDPAMWRVSRSVLVTESDAEAEDYLARPDSGLSFYYSFFIHSFSKGRQALFMLKPDLDMPDEAVTVDAVKRALIIAGSPRRVVEQLVALREEIGPFGTLLMAGHDWDQPKLWRRSMQLLARDVLPVFARG